jgi:Zn-dependent metalloprotease
MCNCRHPVNCILPPYMKNKLDDVLGIKREGTDVDSRIRAKRRFLRAISPVRKKLKVTAVATIPTKLHREVYDAHEAPMELGELIWKEGQKKLPVSRDGRNVIEGAGHVWSFYKKLFDRNSIDNTGLAIIQTIKYRENPDEPFFNAFWDGEQMFYGTGQKKFTKSFTSDLDIIAHELTHGVVDYEARLKYEFQPGALNESFADVFGILVKQWVNKTPAKKSDWLIGKNILIAVNALRSMKEPGKAFKNDPVFDDDEQVAHMKEYKKLPNTENGDYGGVHINSGIPNHAFYITATELAGNAWEKAGVVWYAALTDRKLLNKNSDFKDCAEATLKKAVGLFGKGSKEYKAVELGWKQTGVI